MEVKIYGRERGYNKSEEAGEEVRGMREERKEKRKGRRNELAIRKVLFQSRSLIGKID